VTATVPSDAGGQDLTTERATQLSRPQLAWRLPRRAATVPMARQLLDRALALMGVAQDCRFDIALALTEACTNAIRHAHGANEYQVTVTTNDDQCVIEVVDSGVGLDRQRIVEAGADSDLRHLPPDRGRGLRLIRACTDIVELRPVQPHGLAIRMVKRLTWGI
jgi:serine/threonine-protein kinase RsbW